MEDTIYFYSEDYNANKYVQYGMSEVESWGTWTNGKKVLMILHIEEDVAMVNAYIDIADTFYQPQNVQIFVNDELAYESVVCGNQDISFSFQKKNTSLVRMKMVLPDAIRVCDVTDSGDERELALRLLTMTLSGVETSTVSELPENVINNVQQVSVEVNKDEVFSGFVRSEDEAISFWVPCSDAGRYVMKIRIPNAISPKQLELSTDERMLGLMIKSI